MTLFDAAVIAIILGFLARGLWVGFIRQLASVAALILGFVIAGRFHGQLSPILSAFIPWPQLCFLVTYGLIFLAVFAGVIAIGFLLKKVVTLSLMGWFDRMLGGIFGLLKAGIIVSLGFLVVSGLLGLGNKLFTGSMLTPHLSRSAAFFLGFIKDQQLVSQLLPQLPAISLSDISTVPTTKAARLNPKKVPQ